MFAKFIVGKPMNMLWTRLKGLGLLHDKRQHSKDINELKITYKQQNNVEEKEFTRDFKTFVQDYMRSLSMILMIIALKQQSCVMN